MKLQGKTFLILFMLEFGGGIKITDYCKLSSRSTPCRTKCERSAHCGHTQEPFIELTDTERNMVLERHNQLRDEVTAGGHMDHYIPAVARMHILSYDRELEFLASCWILQCEFAAETRADRLTHAGHAYAQNLYRVSTPTARTYPERFVVDAVDFWFAEWRHLREGVPHVRYARLLQVIAPNTRLLGCAKMHSRGHVHAYRLVCNYAPPADHAPLVLGRLLERGAVGAVEMGTPLPEEADCQLTDDTNYTQLCGVHRPLEKDAFLAPINFRQRGHSAANVVSALAIGFLFAAVNLLLRIV